MFFPADKMYLFDSEDNAIPVKTPPSEAKDWQSLQAKLEAKNRKRTNKEIALII
jgi:hypothetical protein